MITKQILNELEILMVYYRRFPSLIEIANAIGHVGDFLEDSKNGANLFFLKKLKELKQLNSNYVDWDQKIKAISKSKDILTLSKIDKDTLVASCRIISRLSLERNKEMNLDLADAFHGLPYALMLSNLDRFNFFSVYLQPVLTLYKTKITESEKCLIDSWSLKEVSFKSRVSIPDRMQSALTYASKKKIFTDCEGNIMDGHYRVKAAIDQNQTVDVETI